MENSKQTEIPMSPSYKLDKSENGKSINTKLYHDMIGSLLYFIASRSYIIFSIYICKISI